MTLDKLSVFGGRNGLLWHHFILQMGTNGVTSVGSLCKYASMQDMLFEDMKVSPV